MLRSTLATNSSSRTSRVEFHGWIRQRFGGQSLHYKAIITATCMHYCCHLTYFAICPICLCKSKFIDWASWQSFVSSFFYNAALSFYIYSNVCSVLVNPCVLLGLLFTLSIAIKTDTFEKYSVFFSLLGGLQTYDDRVSILISTVLWIFEAISSCERQTR